MKKLPIQGRLATILLTILLAILGSGVGAQPQEISTIVRAVGGRRHIAYDAADTLKNYPLSEVTSVIAEELKSNEDPATRVCLYLVLGQLGSAGDPLGRSLLIGGLKSDERGIELDCLRALGWVPKEGSAEVMPALLEELESAKSDPKYRGAVFDALCGLDADAVRPHLPMIETEFQGGAEAGTSTPRRQTAAYAILRVAGIEAWDTQYRKADEPGRIAALEAFRQFNIKTNTLLNGDLKGRALVRKAALEALKSPLEKLREAALGALLNAVGSVDEFQLETPEQLAINLEVAKAFAELSRTDPSPRLRKQAAENGAAFDATGKATRHRSPPGAELRWLTP